MLGKTLICAYFALPILMMIGFVAWQTIRIRRTTRWPIPDKLLRPPGESCRRKLEQLDEDWIVYVIVPMLLWLLFLMVLLKTMLALALTSWSVFYVVLALGAVATIPGAW